MDIDKINEYTIFRIGGAKAVAYIVENNDTADLKLIQTDKASRGQGLGSELIEGIIDYYKKNGFKYIISLIPEKSLDDDVKNNLISFYLKFGFESLGNDSFKLTI